MDHLSFISWNIRGVCNASNRRNLQMLVNSYKPSILMVQETKCKKMVRCFNGLNLAKIISWLTRGTSRRTLGWSISVMEKIFASKRGLFSEQNWVWLRGSLVPTMLYINIISIYAPHELNDKVRFWHELCIIIEMFKKNEPFLLMGDFNCVRHISDWENCIYRSKDSAMFNNFIEVNNLWEVPPQGFKFTWFCNNDRKSRLPAKFKLANRRRLDPPRKMPEELRPYPYSLIKKIDKLGANSFQGVWLLAKWWGFQRLVGK